MSDTPREPAAPTPVHDLDQPQLAGGPGIEISKRLVLINAISSILRKLIVVGVLVWVQQLYIRRLDPAEYELLPITATLLVFFPLIPSMFAAGLRRYITTAYARRDEAEVTSIVSTMAPLLFRVALIVAAVGCLCAWYIDVLLDIAPAYVGKARAMFALMALTLALRFAVAPFGLGFDLKQRFALRNALGLASEVFKAALLVFLLSLSIDVLWLVVANTTATVLELAVATVLSRRMVPALRIVPGTARRETIGELVQFGGWSVLIQIALIVRDSADVLILNRMASAVENNNFYIGSLPDRHIRGTYIETTANVLPVVTALASTGDEARLRSVFFRMTRYSLWTLLLPSLPLIVYRDEIVELYIGEKQAVYSTVAVVMALLLARVVVIFPNTLLGMVAAAKAQVKPVALRAASMSAANLLLTLYLVGGRGMGAIGSALATLIVTLVGAPLLNWTLAMRLTGSRMGDWLRATFLPGLVPAALAGPVWYLLWSYAPPSGWLALAGQVAVGLAVYALGLALALRPQDRADLAAAWARIRSGKADKPKT